VKGNSFSEIQIKFKFNYFITALVEQISFIIVKPEIIYRLPADYLRIIRNFKGKLFPLYESPLSEQKRSKE